MIRINSYPKMSTAFTMDIKQLIRKTKCEMYGLAVFGCNDANHLQAMRIYVNLFVS